MTEGGSFNNLRPSSFTEVSEFYAGKTASEQSAPQNDFNALQAQIQAHQAQDDNRSLLSWAVSKVWRKDENSLADLQKLAQNAEAARASGKTAELAAMQGQIAEKIQADRDAIGSQDDASHYLGGGLKTAFLFVNGTGGRFLGRAGLVGLAGTVGLYALDQAKVKDAREGNLEFYADMGLGALKGGALKGTFHGLGKALATENAAGKGIGLGMSSRVLETVLTRESYVGADGQYSFGAGANALKNTVMNPRAIVQDAALFSVAHGLSSSANFLTAGAISARPFYQNVLTSGTFGMSNGAFAELERQQHLGNGIDYKQVLYKGLLQGGVDAIAGAPGGLAADPVFRRAPVQALKYDYAVGKYRFAEAQQEASALLGNAKERALDGGRRAMDWIADNMIPKGPQPAFAWAGGEPITGRLTSTSIEPTSNAMMMMNAGEGRGRTGTRGGDRFATPEVSATPEFLARTKEPVTPSSPQEQSFERLLARATSEKAQPKDMQNLFGFMRANPEIDAYAGRVYLERYDQARVRQALEGFYKPDNFTFEPTLSDGRVQAAYQRLDRWMTNPMVRLSENKMVDYLNDYLRNLDADGINLRPVLNQVAATSRDALLIRVLDRVLGTQYGMLLPYLERTRQLPAAQGDIHAARQEAQYLYDVATGKIKPPTQEGETGSSPVVDPGDIAKYEFARRSATGTGSEKVQPSDLLSRAHQVRDQIVNDSVVKLGSPDKTTRQKAIADLAKQFDHPSAGEWFETWRAKAAEDIPLGGLLVSPEVKALPPEAVKHFLASEVPVPTQGGPGMPALQRRMSLMQSVAEQFAHSPEMAAVVLQQGAGNPAALQSLLFKLGHPKDGPAYRQLVEQGLIAGRSIVELSGDHIMNESRIYALFPNEPALAQRLAEMGASGELQLEPLLKRMTHPKFGEQIKDEVRRRVERGDSAAKIEGERVFAELLAESTFKESPEVLVKLLDLADGNPVALQQIVSGPQAPRAETPRGGDRNARPPRIHPRIRDAYFELIRELTPQATSIEQIAHVTTAVKEGNAQVAYEAAAKIKPADVNAWLRVERMIFGIASGDPHAVPDPRPRQQATDQGTQGVQKVETGEPVHPQNPLTGEPLPIQPLVIKPSGDRTVATGLKQEAPVVGEGLPKPEALTAGDAQPTAKSGAEVTGPEVVARATAPLDREGILAQRVERLRQGQATMADIAELAKDLKHPSAAEWYPAWLQAAPSSISLGYILNKAEVQALPPEVVHRFLSADQPAAPPPAPVEQTQPGRRPPRPQPQPKDTVQARLTLLNTTIDSFSPEVGRRLVELGAENQPALREILYKMSHPEFGELYKAMVEQKAGTVADITELSRPSAMHEARILKAFEDAPDIGGVLAEMGAQGQIRLDIVLNRMNNPYFGRTYKEVLVEKIRDASKTVTTEDINGDSIYMEALAQRSMGRWPDTVAKLLEVGQTNSKALQDVLNGPRERAMEPIYRELIRQLAPQAQTIEQLADVANLVKQGKPEAAFEAAIKLRPADEPAWHLTQEILNAVSIGDVAAAQAIERKLPRPPRQEFQGEGRGRDRQGQQRDRQGGRDRQSGRDRQPQRDQQTDQGSVQPVASVPELKASDVVLNQPIADALTQGVESKSGTQEVIPPVLPPEVTQPPVQPLRPETEVEQGGRHKRRQERQYEEEVDPYEDTGRDRKKGKTGPRQRREGRGGARSNRWWEQMDDE